MHLLQNVGHAQLGCLFFAHLSQLTLGNGRLFVTLLQLLVRQKVLRHNARYFLEVV